MIIEESYTFDDVLLKPAYSKIGPADANVGTFISKNIKLILLGMLFIITFQVIIGALLIYMEVPIWMGIFHQSIGLLLFTLIVLLYSHIYLKRS